MTPRGNDDTTPGKDWRWWLWVGVGEAILLALGIFLVGVAALYCFYLLKDGPTKWDDDRDAALYVSLAFLMGLVLLVLAYVFYRVELALWSRRARAAVAERSQNFGRLPRSIRRAANEVERSRGQNPCKSDYANARLERARAGEAAYDRLADVAAEADKQAEQARGISQALNEVVKQVRDLPK